ncbi:MAG TPA: site-specific integrase [Pirellulaceae bacterium]|nr:site-specific integrase [Pirellulaceae bacterium]
MPRLSRATPRLCRVRSQAVVYLKGEANYLGRYGSAEAKRRYRQLLAEWEAADRPTQATPAPADITVAEVCRAYKRYATAYYRSADGTTSGEIHPIKAAIKVLRLLYGTIPATEFGPLAFKALRQWLIERGLSRRTINRYSDRIKRIFKWAVSEQLIQPAVYQALSTVGGLRYGRSAAREIEPVRPVACATVAATLPHLPAVVADMVRLQRLTGCRPGEICILRPGDVDSTGEIWLYRPARHKTAHRGKERVIPLGPKAQAVLRPYLLRPADAFCFSPGDSERKRRQARHDARKTPIAQGNMPGTNRKRSPQRKAGERYNSTSYARAIVRGCEAAFGIPDELRVIPKVVPNIPAEAQEAERSRRQELAKQWRAENCWSPNQLRHAYATEVRHRFGLEASQVTLGHANADVTQVYAERNLSLAVDVAKAVG